MAYEYDDQLIDATAVRRQRLTAALLYRNERLRRQWSDRLRTLLIGAFLTVLLCAGCVAVSFVTKLLSDDPVLSSRTSRSAPVLPSAPATPAADSSTRLLDATPEALVNGASP